MKMTIHPTFDRILVKQLEGFNKTSSGLILPPGSEHPQMQLFEIVAVGPGRMGPDGIMVPVSFKPGDIVMMSGHARGDRTMVLDGVKLGLCTENEIAATVTLSDTKPARLEVVQ